MLEQTLAEFDPTGVEAIVTAVLTLLGIGTGVGIRRGRQDAGAEHVTDQLATLTQQLGTLATQQADTTKELAGIVTTLDRFVGEDLKRMDRAQRRLEADIDSVADSLDLLVSHLGDGLPKTAAESITAKLMRRHRHEVTGRRRVSS